jgi:hypothetical protein
MLMDNNVVASARFKEIIAEIRDLGFVRGAKLQRPGERVASQRRVDFNQGVDARILCKDRMYLRELSSICLSPLRIAFDHLGLKGPYETAVRFSHEFGLNDLSNYMLYNFHDTTPYSTIVHLVSTIICKHKIASTVSLRTSLVTFGI